MINPGKFQLISSLCRANSLKSTSWCTAGCNCMIAGTDYLIWALFFDYSKAFDTVSHRPLLQKLKSINGYGHQLRWLAHYLSSRSQNVCVGGWMTHLPVLFLSRVPQGSVPGPFLFIFYVNDITCMCSQLSDGTVSPFTDDLMLYHTCSAANYHLLQHYIDKLCVRTRWQPPDIQSQKVQIHAWSSLGHNHLCLLCLMNLYSLARVNSYKISCTPFPLHCAVLSLHPLHLVQNCDSLFSFKCLSHLDKFLYSFCSGTL